MSEGLGPAVLEAVARRSYGRLVAAIALRTRSLSLAEDLLSEAFKEALSSWPRDGLPSNPEGWLVTVARRRFVDLVRREKAERTRLEGLRPLFEESSERGLVSAGGGDDRVMLMFACTHPAIAPDVRAALILQTVLGIDAARLAALFLVKPATLGQRLSRAKSRIEKLQVPFELPDPRQLKSRSGAVADAIYAAFTCGWDDAEEVERSEFEAEIVSLARALATGLPDDAEVQGLLALMLYLHSRKNARTREDKFVPLREQDVSRWDWDLIAEAESRLRHAATYSELGRFQLEAAIQSWHVDRARGDNRDPDRLLQLYDGLVAVSPTIGARVARAVALADALSPEAALSELDRLDPSRVGQYQPYWAARGELMLRLRRLEEADDCFQRAIGLSASPAARNHLVSRQKFYSN